jgi:hypothetical protein
MRVAVLQSAYIPWRGYFDIIATVDMFVVYDDVQYSKGTWRNRNRLKFATGAQWITVPVEVSLGQNIDEVKIAAGRKSWTRLHEQQLCESLAGCTYFEDALQLWKNVVSRTYTHLSPLNVDLMRAVCDYLGIGTPIVWSRDYDLQGRSTDRLLQLLRRLGAKMYLSGPAGDAYLSKQEFAAAGISLLYKSYDYEEYSQPNGAFAAAVTILDLIANCGPESRRLIASRSPDTIAVP